MLEFYIAIAILILCRIFDKQIIRIQWNSVSSFLAFMSILTVARLCLFDFSVRNGGVMPSMPPEIMQSGMWSFGLVFWEDLFYAVPLYYAHRWLTPWAAWIFTIIMSVHFGMGHLYQGEFVMYLTMIYPYFISKRFGEKYGFGTVMLCHILYDVFTYYTVYLSPILVGSK